MPGSPTSSYTQPLAKTHQSGEVSDGDVTLLCSCRFLAVAAKLADNKWLHTKAGKPLTVNNTNEVCITSLD